MTSVFCGNIIAFKEFNNVTTAISKKFYSDIAGRVGRSKSVDKMHLTPCIVTGLNIELRIPWIHTMLSRYVRYGLLLLLKEFV